MRRRLRIFRLSAVGTVDPAGEEGRRYLSIAAAIVLEGRWRDGVEVLGATAGRCWQRLLWLAEVVSQAT